MGSKPENERKDKMKILVACEESQAVTIAFRNKGHEAYSCDIQDCSGGHPEWHFKGNVFDYMTSDFDMMIGFPPCTYLTYAGTRHWNNPGRLEKRLDALNFFAKMWTAPIEKICLENPQGCASPTIAKYSQIIQPYYFGDSEQKTTCLWLKNLPLLQHTEFDDLFSVKTHVEKPEPFSILSSGKKTYFADGKHRDPKLRSKTFPGIAQAMADQWG